MKDYIEIIADHIRGYREMCLKRGTRRGDLSAARIYYNRRLDDQKLTLRRFLDHYYNFADKKSG